MEALGGFRRRQGVKVPVPKKVHEGWFTLHGADGRKVGHEWIFWEPHADRTAWFERKIELEGAPIRHLKARFSTEGEAPALAWARYRDGDRTREFTSTGAPDAVPALLAPILAAAAPTAPGEALRPMLLLEPDGRLVGHALVSHGPAPVGDVPCTRFTLERDGVVHAAFFVDDNRRLRGFVAAEGAPHALLATKAAATAPSSAP